MTFELQNIGNNTFCLMMTLIISSFYTSDILNGGLPRVAKTLNLGKHSP